MLLAESQKRFHRSGWLQSVVVLGLCLSAAALRAQYLETTLRLGYYVTDFAWNPTNNHLYVCQNDSNSVLVIDGVTNQTIKTVGTAAYPRLLCVNPVANKVYCTSGDVDRINVIDASGDSLVKKIRSPGFPDRMIFNTLMNRLYVTGYGDNTLRVFDCAGDTLVAEIPFGNRNGIGALLWHPGNNRLFCVTSCGHTFDTVFVFDCLTDTVVCQTAVDSSAGRVCLDPVSGNVYVTSSHGISVLSPAGDSVVAWVPGCGGYMCAVPYPNKVYAARDSWVFVIDDSTHSVTDSIAVGSIAGPLICDFDKGKVYDAEIIVPVIDARGDSLLSTVWGPANHNGPIVWNRINSRFYMLTSDYMGVLVIRDTSTAVAEPGEATPRPSGTDATVLRGTLRLNGLAPAWLLDRTGRKVTRLAPGDNGVSGLASGVYFVRDDAVEPTRKVVIRH